MYRAHFIAALILSMLFLARTAGAGESAVTQWQVIQSVGEVIITTDGNQPIAINLHAPIPEGAIVQTGRNGRAVIRRGEEQIVIHAMSRLVLTESGSDITRITQSMGSAWFKIGKRQAPHFEVDTPYLAAVVKGTSFLVTVSNDKADVQVSEGAVEVLTIDHNAISLVRTGSTALVREASQSQIELSERNHQARIVTSNEGGWSANGAAAGSAGVHSDGPSLRTGTQDINNSTTAGLNSFGTAVSVDFEHSSGGDGSSSGSAADTSGVMLQAPSLRGSADENGNLPRVERSAFSAAKQLTSAAKLAGNGVAKEISAAAKVITNHKPLKVSATFPWRAFAFCIVGLLAMMVFSHVRGLRQRTRNAKKLSVE